MLALTLSLTLAAMPAGQDLPLPPGVTLNNASQRLALPVLITWDASLTDPQVPLVKDDNTTRAGTTDGPVNALAQFAPNVARRHFENASWTEAQPRSIVIKRVAVMFRSGPSYEVTVDVDRYEGDRRLGQASGKGYGQGARNQAQRTGAAYANMFGARPKNGLTEANPVADAEVIRNATLQALDSALLQTAGIWAGEQYAQKMREDAERQIKAAQEAAAAQQAAQNQKKPAKKK